MVSIDDETIAQNRSECNNKKTEIEIFFQRGEKGNMKCGGLPPLLTAGNGGQAFLSAPLVFH